MQTTAHLSRQFQLVATAAALALVGFVVPAAAGASPARIDGVRAAIQHGTLTIRGDDQGNRIDLRLATGDPSVIEVDAGGSAAADFSFARGDVDAIDVKTGDGDDRVRVDDANGSFTNTIPTTISGGDGDDFLTGGLGAETFYGGAGDDSVAGFKGNDTAYLGTGDDVFVWNQGDGSDVVEGQDGSDTMRFNGAAINETATLSANGSRLKFFRVQGNVTMDTNGVETVDDNTLGGADNVTVNDLSGTDVTKVDVDLAGTLGGNAGDGAVDNVVVNATNGDDNLSVAGSGSGVDVTGLAAAVSIRHAEPADSLSLNTLAGTDNVLVNGVAGVLQTFVDGAAV